MVYLLAMMCFAQPYNLKCDYVGFLAQQTADCSSPPPARAKSFGITPKSMGRGVPREKKGAFLFLRLAALFPERSSWLAVFSVFPFILKTHFRPGVGGLHSHAAPPTRIVFIQIETPVGGKVVR